MAYQWQIHENEIRFNISRMNEKRFNVFVTLIIEMLEANSRLKRQDTKEKTQHKERVFIVRWLDLRRQYDNVRCLHAFTKSDDNNCLVK